MDTTQPQIDEVNQKIAILTARIDSLEKEVSARRVQQIAYPLDRASTQIINKALGL